MMRAWPLIAGLLLLAALWLGPLPEMARRAFSPHMILHLGLTLVAAPLVAIGAIRLLPTHWREGAGQPLSAALAVSALEFVVVWGWHAPALHEAAAGSSVMFAVQQASFLAAGLALWGTAFFGRGRRHAAAGALAMLLTSMHMAMLGVLLVLAPRLVYAPQFCLGAFGLDPLGDQQLGGGLMAFFGGGAAAIGGAVLALRLGRERDGLDEAVPMPVERFRTPDRT